jgi:hypothetical protein
MNHQISSNLIRDIPVLPKPGAFSYFVGGEFDHKLAWLLNSNFVASKIIPKNIYSSPFVLPSCCEHAIVY